MVAKELKAEDRLDIEADSTAAARIRINPGMASEFAKRRIISLG